MQDPNFSFTPVGHTALYPALDQRISKDFQLVFNRFMQLWDKKIISPYEGYHFFPHFLHL